jgi:cytidylate kinase
MKNKFMIAVDGASGTGKSTICKLIAKKHELNYIDTGAIYRTLALYVEQKGINVKKINDPDTNKIDMDKKLKKLCTELP